MSLARAVRWRDDGRAQKRLLSSAPRSKEFSTKLSDLGLIWWQWAGAVMAPLGAC
jgi:hypothetical protein